KGKKKILIAQDKEMTYQVVKKVKEEIQEIPIFVKLSPSVTDIKEIVHASLLAGADGITLINTVPALDIDLNFERPVLGNLIGGQSGHSILCIAQRKVAEAKSELLQWEREKGRKVHLIGCGGISTGYDAVKFHLIGVDAVQIGTVLKNDLDVIERMKKEMEQFMSLKGYNSIQDFQGKAFKYLENVV
ncbi:MAG TPA: hypothetical protein EYP29_01210, partial [Thermoplasmata archaeon]|nr:hypothetical protein [Thermoplasmata archaeon]